MSFRTAPSIDDNGAWTPGQYAAHRASVGAVVPARPAAPTDTLEAFLAAVRPDWMRQAACRGLTDLFFPTRGEDTQGTARQAKAVCADCPVIDQCADAGIGEHWGIWGGRTERARRSIRVERHREALAAGPPPCTTPGCTNTSRSVTGPPLCHACRCRTAA